MPTSYIKVFVIKMGVTSYQVESLFKLYKYNEGENKLTKQFFLDYIKEQLSQFGTTDEFLIGNMEEYPELTENEMILLEKWKLA
jgi:hypothetical protein